MSTTQIYVYARNHLKWSNPEPIPGPRIKITPELRDRAVAIQQDKET